MIRAYQSTDLEAVLSAWEAASAVAHPILSGNFLDQERHNIATVPLPRATTLMWEAEGRAVGFIALIGNEVGGLFIDPRFQRDGGFHLIATAWFGEYAPGVITAMVLYLPLAFWSFTRRPRPRWGALGLGALVALALTASLWLDVPV